MVVECNRDPDVSRSLCCLPINIKSKYYPWVFLGIFSLLGGVTGCFSLAVGFGVGYLTIYDKMDRFMASETKVRQMEGKWPFKSLSQKPNF